jgi:hypothetical protein
MSNEDSAGGMQKLLTWGSTGLAMVLGTSFLVGTGDNDKPSHEAHPVVVGAQHVPAAAWVEQHRVLRMRAPLYDFFGIVPPVISDSTEGDKPPPDEASSSSSPPPDPWKIDGEFRRHLACYDLEFLILSVADPIDSVAGYEFDHQVDALQKALTADPDDQWLFSGSYLPWQAFKDHRSVDKKIPLRRQMHWYQDEPGVMLFRQDHGANGPCPCDNADPENATRCKLLLVFLVGESPALGLQRDALQHSIHEIATLVHRNHKAVPGTESEPIEVRIVGPTFSGGAFSLREGLREARKTSALECRIVNGSATAVPPGYFGDDFVGSTVCGWTATRKALEVLTNEEPIAWLIETGTAFASSFSKGRPSAKENAEMRVVDPHEADVVFPYPLGIARVRSDFEQQLAIARQESGALKPINPTTPIPFSADETALDVVPLQTQQITVPGVELLLDQIVRTIRGQRIAFVGIMASDVRDVIFFAELIRLRTPGVQLLIPEPDILLTHREYTDSLRGAIVASSYPLFPEGLEACREKHAPMPVMSSQTAYGLYNAVRLQRLLATGNATAAANQVAGTSGSQFVGLFSDGKIRRPRVWLNSVGYDRFYPLRAQAEKPAHPVEEPYAFSVTADDPSDLRSTKFDFHPRWLEWGPFVAGLLVAGLAGFIWRSRAENLPDKLAPLKALPKLEWSVRTVCCLLMLVAVTIVDIALICRGCFIYRVGVEPDALEWSAESHLFSGVSLLLPLLCSSAAVIGMCYIKLRQAYLADTKMSRQLQQESVPDNLGQIWSWPPFAPVVGDSATDRWFVPLLLLAGLASTFRLIWEATSDVSQRPGLFWATWWMTVVGYVVWWLAALELPRIQRELRNKVKRGLPTRYDSPDWDEIFAKLHASGLRSLPALLIGPAPSDDDAVSEERRRVERQKIPTERTESLAALGLFRQVQCRLIILRNQFALLALGGVMLLMAVVSYPFTSAGGFQTLGTISVLTLVIGACVYFGKLESDENLSRVLGTKPNEVEWNFGTITFFGKYLLLGVVALIIQFVPGTWIWLGKLISPLSHLSH